MENKLDHAPTQASADLEDFEVVELEDRFEFTEKCDTNCGCPPPPPPPPQT
jgi:hypothetical protein